MDVDEARKQFLASKQGLREAATQFATILAWVEFGGVAQDYIAALEQRAAELEAALAALLTTVRQNCLDGLAAEARYYTDMGHPNQDRQAQAVYAEVMAAVEAAADALVASEAK